jgi:hypothetical protein
MRYTKDIVRKIMEVAIEYFTLKFLAHSLALFQSRWQTEETSDQINQLVHAG